MPSKYANRNGKRDRVPVALVIPHVQNWAKRSDDGMAPADILAARLGMNRTTFERLIANTYTSPHMAFDMADRIFCALGQPTLIWRSSDELKEIYEKASKGADDIEAGVEIPETPEQKERRLARARRYAHENREKKTAYQRKYRAKNKEKVRENDRRYRARKRAEVQAEAA